tara:strand:+ start:158 stop:493 length:336 start_codon:yes stop_codon:yes gene_type:complete
MEKQQLVEFEPIIGPQDYNNLICPNCGADYLRHRAVRVYNRDEDSNVCRRTIASHYLSQVLVTPNDGGNPSGRRDGLTIDFTCESCSGDETVAQLCVAQHKGRTEMFWRSV